MLFKLSLCDVRGKQVHQEHGQGHRNRLRCESLRQAEEIRVSNSINVVMWLDVALFVALKGLQNERDQFPSHFGAWHPVRKVDLASWRMELMAGWWLHAFPPSKDPCVIFFWTVVDAKRMHPIGWFYSVLCKIGLGMIGTSNEAGKHRFELGSRSGAHSSTAKGRLASKDDCSVYCSHCSPKSKFAKLS